MKHSILFILLFIVGLLQIKAENITVDGTSRSYLVYAPSNLGENRPLFIFCHGSGQDANYMLNTQFRDTQNPERKISIENVCDTAKFVILFPNGINNQWDIGGNRDINLVKALIDKMAEQYKIDRNRVYLGGFSMGGMFTYHAMNKIPDLIAAFVPVSGYPMGGATANADVRPLPILHIHGTGDDVCGFSGAQPALNVWIKHNGCPTTAKTIENYNGFNAKMHTWEPGKDGVQVKLLELADKGHWVCKEPQVYTGKEMWNFCKNYSLNKTTPNVTITSPKANTRYINFAPSGEAKFPDITISANADDPNGTIKSVKFYNGNILLATCTSEPYQAVLKNAVAGKRTLKVVATDNDGESSTTTVDINLLAPSTHTISSAFNEGGMIPEGWVTYDGKEQRAGYSNGYSLGCRVLEFTGTTRGMNYGLYFRNVDGNEREGWAKYGHKESNTTINLWPGQYTLKYKICNWNKPEFSPVELNIERRSNGESVAIQTYAPTINIGNVASNNFKSLTQESFDFEIKDQDDYVVSIYTDDVAYGDCIIGQLALTANGYITTDIKTPTELRPNTDTRYDLSGKRINNHRKSGIYIHDGKKVLIK